MFLNPEDLGQVIYDYQVNEITENDENKVLQALQAGTQEVRGYLAPNRYRKDSYDGRPLYDVAAIFSATGDARNAIILQHTLTVAKWHLVQLCNADIIYEQAKERYDRAVAWLRDVAAGVVIMDELPTITLDSDETVKPFSYGSRQKFNHE